ncbi:MAG: hypothetical protein ABIP48_06860 [Planctomycetota bacterium]
MLKTTTLLLLFSGACALGATPAEEPPDFVPLGVYLSWERPGACARWAGIDRWEDVSRRLDAIAANHVDTLWVTNMAEADLPRLIAECERRNIKLLPSMSTIEGKIEWRWADGAKYYDAAVPRVVKLAGDSKTLIGWVLSDEPSLEALPRMEELRLRFQEADPDRFCLVVSMWPQTPQVPVKTNLPVVCVDLYPFFGPNDPNGPHTDGSSRAFLRNNARRMVEAIGEKETAPWLMGMCFSDIWGPRKYNAEWHLVGLPGSYLHWRCPSLAEIRWQVWEAIRSRCKGVLIYTLAPEAPDPKTETLPPPDVAWKNVLAKTATDLGPNALTNPDGTPTPQLEELGRAYERIAPHKDLIRRWKPAALAAAEVTPPGQIQCFIDPATERGYAVVVNDDLKSERTIEIRLKSGRDTLLDVARGGEIELADSADGTKRGTLALSAGEGTILETTAGGRL